MEQDARDPLILSAIKVCGSQKALAEAMGVEQQTVSKLLLRQRRVTGEMAARIHRATDGAVPMHVLRPDIFAAVEAAA